MLENNDKKMACRVEFIDYASHKKMTITGLVSSNSLYCPLDEWLVVENRAFKDGKWKKSFEQVHKQDVVRAYLLKPDKVVTYQESDLSAHENVDNFVRSQHLA